MSFCTAAALLLLGGELALTVVSVSGRSSSALPRLVDWHTKWQKVQVCGKSMPAKPQPCPGGPYNSSDVCFHMRCCWVVVGAESRLNSDSAEIFSCIMPWSPDTHELGDSQFYDGDQAIASLANARGGLQSASNGDVLAVESLSFAPFFQGAGESFPADLMVSGRRPLLHSQRWRPFEIVRRGTLTNEDISIETGVRMGFEETTVLFQMTLSNNQEYAADITVSMRLPALVRWYSPTGWEWGHPGPNQGDSHDFTAILTHDGQSLRSCDKRHLELQATLDACNASDPNQRWTGAALLQSGASAIKNIGAGKCLSTIQQEDVHTVATEDCNSTSRFLYNQSSGQIFVSRNGSDDKPSCLDVNNGIGPNIGLFPCHNVTSPDYQHQQFDYDVLTKVLRSRSAPGKCATLTSPPLRACTGIAFAQQSPSNEYTSCKLSVEQGVGSATCDSINILPQMSVSVALVLHVGLDTESVDSIALEIANHFEHEYDKSLSDMQTWWEAAFIPHNRYFSGNLPSLETPDPDLSRSYYGGLLSFLLNAKKVKTTGIHNLDDPELDGPVNWTAFTSVGPSAGSTAMYMWDTGYTSDIWGLLDPAGLKHAIELFLKSNVSKFNVVDDLTLQGAGKYYAFSDLATFLTIHSMVILEGQEYAVSSVAGKPLIQWMDELSTAWTAFANTSSLGMPGLADYGPSPNNFLECVPTYVHAVAALQAGNTWMMRETARAHLAFSNRSRAVQLFSLSNQTRDATLSLYVPGHGYFASAYPSGKRVEVRTCVDFLTVATSIPQDVDPSMAKEMVHFVERELLTPDWMRALSMEDAVAAESDRADHGPRGAWDGWVGLTARGLGELGRHDIALEMLRASAKVLEEGPYGQAHRVYGPNNIQMLSQPRKGGDQAYLAVCGGTIASAVIRTLFGFSPRVDGPDHVSDATQLLHQPHISRGFTGVLRNVRYRDKLFDIISGPDGLSIQEHQTGLNRDSVLNI